MLETEYADPHAELALGYFISGMHGFRPMREVAPIVRAEVERALPSHWSTITTGRRGVHLSDAKRSTRHRGVRTRVSARSLYLYGRVARHDALAAQREGACQATHHGNGRFLIV